MSDPERRDDYSKRDRIDEIGENLTTWAQTESAKNEAWAKAASEAQAVGMESISKRLTLGLVIGIVFVVIAITVSGIALGKSVGRQDVLADQQSKMTKAQARTDKLASDLADVVGQIRDQRLSNTRIACEKEAADNAKLLAVFRRAGTTETILDDFARSFPSKIDCEARVDAVRVDPK